MAVHSLMKHRRGVRFFQSAMMATEDFKRVIGTEVLMLHHDSILIL
jgi:hypothetical protein